MGSICNILMTFTVHGQNCANISGAWYNQLGSEIIPTDRQYRRTKTGRRIQDYRGERRRKRGEIILKHNRYNIISLDIFFLFSFEKYCSLNLRNFSRLSHKKFIVLFPEIFLCVFRNTFHCCHYLPCN